MKTKDKAFNVFKPGSIVKGIPFEQYLNYWKVNEFDKQLGVNHTPNPLASEIRAYIVLSCERHGNHNLGYICVINDVISGKRIKCNSGSLEHV